MNFPVISWFSRAQRGGRSTRAPEVEICDLNECHGIRGDQLSPNPAAPTFPKLAAEPSTTEYSLRALLRSPHETMPHITFTPEQMDDIVDYMMSLKPRE